ncbi:PTS system mannose/fructose/N-acetylgalactosamine-transporter subunit IIB [Pectinatus frisingensis]|uniref:PTS system mannose/fructose/N-acetylgalactosamine-transporter subunit IIB n=1 Tax=Pectinatus frisingensis TaxID=865 RepID=UPI0018C658FD|nr:PTS sugar transporter subunit IIB [Pectinatus frisingensis]
MGSINLTRIDSRLIHGQVMTKWVKGGYNINAIFVVDDELANDKLMRDIYLMSAGNSGVAINVFSIDDIIKYWKEKQFDNYRVLLLCKTLGTAEKIIDGEVPIKLLNIGGIAKKKDSKFVISSVAMDKNDITIMKRIYDKGVQVFFQIVPDTKKVSYDDGLKILS